MEGEIEGFQLRFKLDQPAAQSSKTERIDSGFGDLQIIENQKENISTFLDVPFECFLTHFKKMAKHPNFDRFVYTEISARSNGSIFLEIIFKGADT